MSDTETSHFWVGHFPAALAEAYLAEVWDERDEERENIPLSLFARDQGEKWYDHDFLEHGFRDEDVPIAELAAGRSYSDQWAGELARRATAEGIGAANFLVLISRDEIECPRSVDGSAYGYWLRYLGTIRYHI